MKRERQMGSSATRAVGIVMRDIEECIRCQGSGEIGVDVRGRFERAGPVPDDAKGFAIATCPSCMGMGYVETDES